ncbi:hypothetical protein MtrunA17_Chr7g0219231 [Medicago truncatula]|uniref:Transmembrane protein, putative n=1 Tax=Medicago truncatula TaxID=3880 RepID=G7L687_MEDTR|nr:transmembrane protein, putative [Medicago truncatula]RHN44418.1 hypothetical protein MtrunA17_Chr7g0219231 [Medicago truncatula]
MAPPFSKSAFLLKWVIDVLVVGFMDSLMCYAIQYLGYGSSMLWVTVVFHTYVSFRLAGGCFSSAGPFSARVLVLVFRYGC